MRRALLIQEVYFGFMQHALYVLLVFKLGL